MAQQQTGQSQCVPEINVTEIEILSGPDNLLGMGGFGEVRKAIYNKNLTAAKILIDRGLEFTSRDIFDLKKEARRLQEASHHDYIINIYGLVLDQKLNAVILEYMQFNNVKCFICSYDVDVSLRVNMVAQIISAMSYLHHNKIKHLDMKADNVLVNNQFNAKICDFGLSKLKTISLSMSKALNAPRRGTLTHVAPELLLDINMEPTNEQDIYSFSVTIWEIFTGKEPFYAVCGNNNLIRLAVIAGQRPPLNDIIEGCHDDVQMLIENCWAHCPNDRPSFAEIDEMFEPVYKHHESGIMSAKQSVRRQICQKYKSGDEQYDCTRHFNTAPPRGLHVATTPPATAGQQLQDDTSTDNEDIVLPDASLVPAMTPDTKFDGVNESFRNLSVTGRNRDQNANTPQRPVRDPSMIPEQHGANQTPQPEENSNQIPDDMTLVKRLGFRNVDGVEGLRSDTAGHAVGDTMKQTHQQTGAQASVAQSRINFSLLTADQVPSGNGAQGTQQGPPTTQPSFNAGQTTGHHGGSTTDERTLTVVPEESADVPPSNTGQRDIGLHPRSSYNAGVHESVPVQRVTTETIGAYNIDKSEAGRLDSLPVQRVTTGDMTSHTSHQPEYRREPNAHLPYTAGNPVPSRPLFDQSIQQPPTDVTSLRNFQVAGPPTPENRNQYVADNTGRVGDVNASRDSGTQSAPIPPTSGAAKKSKKPRGENQDEGDFTSNAGAASFTGNPDHIQINHKHAGGAFTQINMPGQSVKQPYMFFGSHNQFVINESGDNSHGSLDTDSINKCDKSKLTTSTEELSFAQVDMVATKAGKEWRRLCRNLGLDDPELDQLEHDYFVDGLYEIMYQGIRKWKQKKGREATLHSMAVSLWNIDKDDLALKLPQT